MPQWQQRRPAYRPPRSQKRDRSGDQGLIDAARRLLATHDAHGLRSLVEDLRESMAQAACAAYDQPSPEALSLYRRAMRELAEAERALTHSEEAA